MFLKDVLLYYILWLYEVFFSWLLFWWLFEVFAQPFVLDGQGPYLSSLLLLLEPVHLRHYSGRINMSELVCHPLVGFIWGKPQSWALVHDEWAACHQWSFERERWVCLCVEHPLGWEEIPHLLSVGTFVSWSKEQLSCLERWIQSLVCWQKHVFVFWCIVLISLLHEHCLH